jgi:hypothetical protein
LRQDTRIHYKLITRLLIPLIICFIFSVRPLKAGELNDNFSKIQYQDENVVLAGQIQKLIPPALEHVTGLTGLQIKGPLNIKLFKNTADFRKASGIKYLSVQGIAVSEFNLVFINSENIFRQSKSDISHLLEHEITHIVLGTNISHDSSNQLPRWFNEGVAQWASSDATELFSASYQNSLQTAFLNKSLIPFSELTYYFPADQDGFILAYAQSMSFIGFLTEKYGESQLVKLLNLLVSEKNFAEAFQKNYGEPFERVENDWKSSKKQTMYTLDYYFATHINSFIDSLLGLTALIVFTLLYFRNRIKKKKIREIEELPDN